MDKTDAELVGEVQDGEILAFEILVKRYQARLVRWVVRKGMNEEDAAEVVQDALLAVYRTIERVDVKQKFTTYLFAVVKNMAVSRLRRTKKEGPLPETVAGDDDVVERVVAKEEGERVRKAVRNLPEKQRRVVELYYWENLRYEQIAQKLKTPINTVRTWLFRAKEKLEEEMNDHSK